MNLIKGIGTGAELCTSMACGNILKGLIRPTGTKFIDQVVIPIGTMCMSYAVSSTVKDVIVADMEKQKSQVEKIKEVRKHIKELDTELDKIQDDICKNFAPELATRFNNAINLVRSGKISPKEFEYIVEKLKTEYAEKEGENNG